MLTFVIFCSVKMHDAFTCIVFRKKAVFFPTSLGQTLIHFWLAVFDVNCLVKLARMDARALLRPPRVLQEQVARVVVVSRAFSLFPALSAPLSCVRITQRGGCNKDWKQETADGRGDYVK